MAPCDFAAGMAGDFPQAGVGFPSVIRRTATVPVPTKATNRAKMLEKLNRLLLS
jgi:hypothetical protein